jgi:hypothetical protein
MVSVTQMLSLHLQNGRLSMLRWLTQHTAGIGISCFCTHVCVVSVDANMCYHEHNNMTLAVYC